MFKEVSPKQNFPELEEEIIKYWKKEKIFQKTLKRKNSKGNFVFFEGPPSANGRPGIHHIESRVYKDIILRYRTMAGYYVERKAGWDTHGLPVELQVEKELGINSKKEIETYGIAKFNQKCRESVWRYLEQWKESTERIGFWLDLEHPYVTYENTYIESVWWILKIIWDKKLVYQGYKVVPYCPRCGTALASHEVAQGYQSVNDPSLYVKFRSAAEPKTYFLVWTTTPWTLPSNIALAFGPKITYVKVKKDKEYLVVAENRLSVVPEPYEIVEKFSGKELVEKIAGPESKGNRQYEPLFDIEKLLLPEHKSYQLILGDFVSTEDGTGIVHIAPAYGADDMAVKEQNNLNIPFTVDLDGREINNLNLPGEGKFFKEANQEIIENLKNREIIYKLEEYTHDYPFCWRCDTALIYYAKTSWFIEVSKLRKKLLDNAKIINWVPSYIKEGRFGEWLKDAKDWAISRERYWGTPLPFWVCRDCGAKHCIGSLEELAKMSLVKVDAEKLDLHRPEIDEITLKCPECGGTMNRIKEVLDVWFDSGAMPFAQWHYPFENKEKVDKNVNFPADYISEAIDQTRGWFYTLLTVSTLLGRGAPYKNVICLGHVLDEFGKKMSKSRGNVIEPNEVINEFGADALRFYFYTVNQPGEPKLFARAQVAETLRKNILILWNIYSFFVSYANTDKWKPAASRKDSNHILDRWIVSYLYELTDEVTTTLNNCDVFKAARALSAFINDLSTWYLRRSRKRRDKQFYATLYQVLVDLSKLLAPFTPFIAEEIYRNLTQGPSVHLADWPAISNEKQENKLLGDMEKTRKTVEIGHALRAAAILKVRQPLGRMTVIWNGQKPTAELIEIILDELNVKSFEGKPPEYLKKVEGFVFASQEGIEVGIDTNISRGLKLEGIAREIIRQVQQLRKSAKAKISDSIEIFYDTAIIDFDEAVQKFGQIIKSETLAKEIAKKWPEETDAEVEIKELKLGIKKK